MYTITDGMKSRRSKRRNERAHARGKARNGTNGNKLPPVQPGQRAKKNGRIFQRANQHTPPPLLFGIVLYSTKQPTRPRPTRPTRQRQRKHHAHGSPAPAPAFQLGARFFPQPGLSYLLLPSHPFRASLCFRHNVLTLFSSNEGGN